jgi:hypothetical protein
MSDCVRPPTSSYLSGHYTTRRKVPDAVSHVNYLNVVVHNLFFSVRLYYILLLADVTFSEWNCLNISAILLVCRSNAVVCSL